MVFESGYYEIFHHNDYKMNVKDYTMYSFILNLKHGICTKERLRKYRRIKFTNPYYLELFLKATYRNALLYKGHPLRLNRKFFKRRKIKDFIITVSPKQDYIFIWSYGIPLYKEINKRYR